MCPSLDDCHSISQIYERGFVMFCIIVVILSAVIAFGLERCGSSFEITILNLIIQNNSLGTNVDPEHHWATMT